MSIYQNQVKLETSVSKSALKFYQKQFQDTQVVDLFKNTEGFKYSTSWNKCVDKLWHTFVKKSKKMKTKENLHVASSYIY